MQSGQAPIVSGHLSERIHVSDGDLGRKVANWPIVDAVTRNSMHREGGEAAVRSWADLTSVNAVPGFVAFLERQYKDYSTSYFPMTSVPTEFISSKYSGNLTHTIWRAWITHTLLQFGN